MLSYTRDIPTATYALPPQALSNPLAAEKWANSLPPAAQVLLAQKARTILLGMDAATRVALGRYLAKYGAPVPIECGMNGLGTLGDDASGGYGAAIGALIGAASSIYAGREANNLQRDILGNTLATDRNIAQIQANASVASTQALAAVQGAAAQIAGQTALARSQTHGQTLVTVMPWIAGMAGMGVVAFGIWAYMKRKKR
jgi:hypothetical protein